MASIPVANVQHTGHRGVVHPRAPDRFKRAGKYGATILAAVAFCALLILVYVFTEIGVIMADALKLKWLKTHKKHHNHDDDHDATIVAECIANYPSLSDSLSESGFAKGRFCEGYWQTDEKDTKLPKPVPRSSEFCGEASLRRILQFVERRCSSSRDDSAVDEKNKMAGVALHMERQRGMSSSRLEDGVLLGNVEYVASVSGSSVCWTGDLLDYYIAKYHVVPSREFASRLLQIYRKIPV